MPKTNFPLHGADETTKPLTPTWPTCMADLANWQPCDNLWLRGTESRLASANRIGFTDFDMTQLLGCSMADYRALIEGTFDTTYGVGSQPMERSQLDMTPSVQKLVLNYRRFLTAAEQCPARPVAQPVPSEVTQLEAGTVNPQHVAALKANVKGFHGMGARRNSLVTNIQAMTTVGLSVASLAAAIDVPTDTTFKWLAGMETVPVSDGATRYWVALTYLAAGTPLSYSASKAARSGNFY